RRSMADDAKTILVVDDDPDAREFLTTVLVDNGFAVTTANDGVEAITRIEEAAPDLVALDITMPEKSGVAVYRKLKEDDQLKSIPVIIITGISDDFKKFISTRRQVPPPEGYISKPVDHEQFLSMVRELLA
ncbi:MAG: response regulator, partial [Planctomycetota bacterium]